ncbi:choline ABC transporter substrate-binding protein [Martelella sp.]|uniref:choline ABC transporter substrate-binding protein n=1 Tax=Martelella sp. TaxID=1969699 RepID=UPI0025C23323|nr:choline ABC transporter substrate-binding protein [Martelella sp.]
MKIKLLSMSAAALLAPQIATAQVPDVCTNIRIADGGWTDNAAQNGFVTNVLKGLGYEPEIDFLSLGVLLEGMQAGNVDVFLASWTPNSDATLNPYIESGAIMNVGYNLVGAQYALAVPKYTYDAGLQSFADIEDFYEELDGNIYGLEPGNDSNNVIVQMQEDGAFGFDRFNLVESSESAMLSAVERAVKRNEPIVFVGWSPHPMNTRFEMEYLGGGDDYFGPNYGSAKVWTGLRPGYVEQCPNATRFFEQLRFTVESLSVVMSDILDNDANPEDAARTWLQENPEILDSWLDGVQTVDGQPGLEAVRASLAE